VFPEGLVVKRGPPLFRPVRRWASNVPNIDFGSTSVPLMYSILDIHINKDCPELPFSPSSTLEARYSGRPI